MICGAYDPVNVRANVNFIIGIYICKVNSSLGLVRQT